MYPIISSSFRREDLLALIPCSGGDFVVDALSYVWGEVCASAATCYIAAFVLVDPPPNTHIHAYVFN